MDNNLDLIFLTNKTTYERLKAKQEPNVVIDYANRLKKYRARFLNKMREYLDDDKMCVSFRHRDDAEVATQFLALFRVAAQNFEIEDKQRVMKQTDEDGDAEEDADYCDDQSDTDSTSGERLGEMSIDELHDHKRLYERKIQKIEKTIELKQLGADVEKIEIDDATDSKNAVLSLDIRMLNRRAQFMRK